MLSHAIDLADIDGRHWANWWRLLVPPPVLDHPRWVLVVVESAAPLEIAKVIVAGHEARGAIDPRTVMLPALEPKWLRALGRSLDAGAVIAIEVGALARLTAEIERALTLDMDLLEQGLVVLRALKKLSGRGVWSEPHLLDLLPAPSYEPIQRTFDLLIPDGSALAAYVIEDDHSAIHASIIATKRGGDIDRAATHLAIADLVPEAAFARDWVKGHKRVLSAIEERFAKPSLALFLERATLLRVITGPGDQLAREVNGRNVVIDPSPTWLLGLLGGATMAAFASRGARALAAMLPPAARSRASELASRAQAAMKESGAHPFSLLGFDPLELWASLKHYYRPKS